MKNLDLENEKIGKLLISFSIPCIISMLINSVYNIVDQIFIGQGVGTLGNAATNVIFPIVIICNAVASLVGNGAAANFSLKLGEKNLKEAKKSLGGSITLLFIVSIIIAILGEIFLPILVNAFGCTPNVYDYAITYGRIILIGAPFMIIYTGLSSIIRADGSPKYSMVCLVIGVIINIILDYIFILVFNMGVAGGALATIIGQFVSLIIALIYIPRIKSVKLSKEDYKLDKSVLKTLGLGLSSFITQMTILALFVVMNNLMTIFGAGSKFGSDIPLSVYSIVSKVNSLYISTILGMAIGSQPIIGYNYGAGNYKRVKEILKKVFLISFVIGVIFNLLFYIFPEQITSMFITNTDPNYDLVMEFSVDFFRIFLMVIFINIFEMCASITIQSLGNIKKSTLVSFTRQIILFIPLAIILSNIFGLYGSLYAGPIADSICFIIVLFVIYSEYHKLTKLENTKQTISKDELIITKSILNKHYVITIAREYGSGGRYVGKLLAESLGIPFYDKELIRLTAKESGFTEKYIEENEQTKKSYYQNDNDIFLAESKVIKKISKESCVIIGRCADYVLRDKNNVYNVFLYSDKKEERVTKYYGIDKNNAKKTIDKINKERAKHYKFYTNNNWYDLNHYDIAINVDSLGIEKTAELLKNIILKKNLH